MSVAGAELPRYIAVEGPIGVGKTTLTHMLARHLSARVVLEEFDDNPFLREFYLDRQAQYFADYAREYTDMPLLVRLVEQDGRLVPDRLVRGRDGRGCRTRSESSRVCR